MKTALKCVVLAIEGITPTRCCAAHTGLGAKLDFRDSNGRMPLSCAAEKGHEAVLRMLLEEGAELDSKDS
jgi:hypothetical protein